MIYDAWINATPADLFEVILLSIGVALGIGASAQTFLVPAKELIWATFAGFLGWEVTYCLQQYEVSSLSATTLGAFTISITAELLARDRKMPAPIYVVPAIIPLVPGRASYNAMLSYINSKYDPALEHTIQALFGAGGIALGMLLGTAVARALVHPSHRLRAALEREAERHLHSQLHFLRKQNKKSQEPEQATLIQEVPLLANWKGLNNSLNRFNQRLNKLKSHKKFSLLELQRKKQAEARQQKPTISNEAPLQHSNKPIVKIANNDISSIDNAMNRPNFPISSKGLPTASTPKVHSQNHSRYGHGRKAHRPQPPQRI